jgi:hypothetical protein
MLSLEELFCSVDDFCLLFEPLWHKQLMRDALKHRHRHRQLCLSEIMTIEIAFHQSHYRNFKAFYQEKVHGQWSAAFPGVGELSTLCRMGVAERVMFLPVKWIS